MMNRYIPIDRFYEDEYLQWERVSVSDAKMGSISDIDKLVTNVWTFYVKYPQNILMVYFKSPEDAIMFKLMSS